MSTTVVPQHKFEYLASLPALIAIDEATSIRRIVPEDAPSFAEIIANNPDTRQYVTWAALVHGPNDVVPALQSRSNAAIDGRYAIVHQGSLVGYVGIFPGEQKNEYGIGYFLDQSARGRGLVGQAVAALTEAAKTTLNPKHLYLQIDPENTPSVAIAERLGFQPAETIWDTDLQLHEQRFRLEIPA